MLTAIIVSLCAGAPSENKSMPCCVAHIVRIPVDQPAAQSLTLVPHFLIAAAAAIDFHGSLGSGVRSVHKGQPGPHSLPQPKGSVARQANLLTVCFALPV